MQKPTILITNDDGIDAVGIYHLWKALVDIANVYIVAPSQERSGSGVGLTLRCPLETETVSWEKDTPAWKVNGTPADCVKIGLHKLSPVVPDLIVSGLNRGCNPCKSLFHSGTIGAAIEAAWRGIPSISFSCEAFSPPNFGSAEKYVSTIVKHILESPLPKGTLLNVNFPSAKIIGFKIAQPSRSYWLDQPEEQVHASGKTYYWVDVSWNVEEEEDDSEIAYLQEGFVTAVPICISDLVHQNLLESRKQSFESLFP